MTPSDLPPLAVNTPGCSRRDFLDSSTRGLVGLTLLGGTGAGEALGSSTPVKHRGPGARYTPRIHAAFVRRKEDYGMLWPGAIYDGEAARSDYTRQLRETERDLGLAMALRETPIHSLAEAQEWIAAAKANRADGLLVILLDRQQHAWPTAQKAADAGLPTVVFAPVGAAFTTNTAPLAGRTGLYLCSTSDFKSAAYGLKMLKAAARLREMRFVVLRGNRRLDAQIGFFGTHLRYLPAAEFLTQHERTPVTNEVRRLAADYVRRATARRGPTREDVQNGIKSYLVAQQILEAEDGDGITMDCLGALGRSTVSLPCIAWSRMLDDGIPAACEADLGAAVTHALVQFLFDRPGFQQDPVPETARQCLIGAHCTCPTRLRGFAERPERFDLTHHHGKRDAVPRPVWRLGQRVTVADVLLAPEEELTRDGQAGGPRMLISTGTVVDNVAVPPAGGCVVSVMVKLDTTPDLLRYPGFHQLFFYGDFRTQLEAYCRLFGIEPLVA